VTAAPAVPGVAAMPAILSRRGPVVIAFSGGDFPEAAFRHYDRMNADDSA
jgi:hypothetical protein